MAALDDNISGGEHSKQVQERLLDVAEKLFSEKGFDATTVRNITSEAECNLAAVNYHFGGKDKLYFEVFRRRLIVLRDIRIKAIEKVMSQGNVTLKELLSAFAAAFIEPILDRSQGQQLMKLMVREMLAPRLPKRMFAEQMAIPTMKAFGKAMARVCPELGQKEAVMSMISVIGQLMHTIHLNEIFGTEQDSGLAVPNLTDMVDHIVAFSTAGIYAYVGGKTE